VDVKGERWRCSIGREKADEDLSWLLISEQRERVYERKGRFNESTDTSRGGGEGKGGGAI
jgi:hypothetical protein